jgi:quinolinate synthase
VLLQEQISQDYMDLSREETDRRLQEAKKSLGSSLLILGHHYQQDDVIKFADLRGDSFKLARQAAERREAEFIVFCGVHFMAESADILSAPHQKVILPDLNAGCSMADMADIEDVEYCWEQITGASRTSGEPAASGGAGEPGASLESATSRGLRDTVAAGASGEPAASGASAVGTSGDPGASGGSVPWGESVASGTSSRSAASSDSIVPITYINSAARLKAFCGRNGGAVCTSSNAAAVLEWAFGQGRRVLFFPDQHLGRNTAYKMGVGLDEMALWDPSRDGGGLSVGAMRSKRVVLWNGFCSVHQRFTTEQVRAARDTHPGIKILVHPECAFDVVQMADYCGSTEYIIKTVKDSPPGTQWAIGTEINLVHRLAGEHPDKLIVSLDPIVCVCSTMYRIDPAHLLWALDNLAGGRIVNRIQVPPDEAKWAKVALDRMLQIT